MPFKDADQRREYQRQWVARRRAEFFSDKCCAVCGSTDRMELDHIDGSSKVDHRIWSWSQERRDLEISKCQVLCHVHHLEKTVSEKLVPLVHGTNAGYNKEETLGLPHCHLCRRAHADREQQRRDRVAATTGP